jgi:hypothetical protein
MSIISCPMVVGVTHNRLTDTPSLMWLTKTIWKPHTHHRLSKKEPVSVETKTMNELMG